MKKILYIIILTAVIFAVRWNIVEISKKFFYQPRQSEESLPVAENSHEEDFNVLQRADVTEMEFFNKITEQVRRDWEPDAKMYRIYAETTGNDIDDFLDLSCYYRWNIDYISTLRKRKIEVSIYSGTGGDIDGIDIVYAYKNTYTGHTGRTTIDSIKQNVEYKIEESDIVSDYSSYVLPDEWFGDWQVSFKDIGNIIYNTLNNDIRSKDSIITVQLCAFSKYQGNVVWEIKWLGKGKPNTLIIDAKSGSILENTSPSSPSRQ